MPMAEPNSPSAAVEESGFDSGLYRLLAWLSPAFPAGSFAFSHGLEAAAESGAVHDRNSLQHWIGAMVTLGSGRIDADILHDAHHAAAAGDIAGLIAVNRRGLAFRATAETALETTAQGTAFLETCGAAWPEPFLKAWAAALDGNAVCYAAAVGAAAARASIALDWALGAYLQAMAANLVSAGLRLGIIGQTDGQRILAALEPAISMAVSAAQTRDPGSFGSTTLAVELASIAHETQYTRLFRS
jgi:urease accessory protein